MVRSCSLKNCSNSVKQKYRFFVLPSVKKVPKRTAWLRKCGHLLPENLPVSGNSVSLCEGHFEPDQFIEYGPNVRTILKPTAVPTIFTRNPPRVCDAVEKKVKKSLKSGITDESEAVAREIGLIDSTDNVDMMNAAESDDNQLSDTSLRTDLDPNLSQVKKELILLSNSINLEKNESSSVKLLRIKKSCMLVSTPVGNKIVPAAKKNIANLHQPVQSVLLSGYDDNIDSIVDDESEISIINNKKSTAPNQSLTQENLEHFLGSNSPHLNMDDFESLSECSQFSNVDCKNQTLKLISAQNKMSSMKINKPTFAMPNNETHLDRATNKSEKPFILEVTSVDLESSTPSVTLQLTEKCRQSDTENQLGTETKSDNVSNSTTEQSTSNHKIQPQTKDSDKKIPVDELEMVIRTAARGSNDDNTPIFYSPECSDVDILKKRVHELEIERDYAIRKYRRLAVKMEVFYRNLKLFLNDDQIRNLEVEPSAINTLQWSKETLEKSIKMRSIVGSKGYEHLRTQEHFPLPSFRTLYRYKNKFKPNAYLHKTIADENSLKNEAATEDIMLSDNEITIDKEILPEHIKIEILDDEYFSDSEFTSKTINDVNKTICKIENISEMDVDK